MFGCGWVFSGLSVLCMIFHAFNLHVCAELFLCNEMMKKFYYTEKETTRK